MRQIPIKPEITRKVEAKFGPTNIGVFGCLWGELTAQSLSRLQISLAFIAAQSDQYFIELLTWTRPWRSIDQKSRYCSCPYRAHSPVKIKTMLNSIVCLFFLRVMRRESSTWQGHLVWPEVGGGGGDGSETSRETETQKLTRSYPEKEAWRRVAGAVVFPTKGRYAWGLGGDKYSTFWKKWKEFTLAET